jgi:predicted nuclease of predicted toxin-antitoxin system
MRILVDENIPTITVDNLRTAGHDVRDIRGTAQQGSHDDVLWEMAQSEKRMLITTDKGFTGHRDENHWGILLIRLRQPNEAGIHARIQAVLNQFPESEWPECCSYARYSPKCQPITRWFLGENTMREFAFSEWTTGKGVLDVIILPISPFDISPVLRMTHVALTLVLCSIHVADPTPCRRRSRRIETSGSAGQA